MTHEETVLDYIKRHGPVEGNAVVVMLESRGIPRTTTFSYLSALHKSKKISRAGYRRHYIYYISGKGSLQPGEKIKVNWNDGIVYDAEVRAVQGSKVVAFFPADGSVCNFSADWVA